MGKRDRPNDTRETKVSKKLSQLLRHRVRENNLTVRTDGYVRLDDVLAAMHHLTPTADEVRAVVATCPKQRFALLTEDAVEYIRANQGHTIDGLDDEQMLQPLGAPALAELREAVHGTFLSSWPAIRSGGLRRMARKHVHMATDLPGESGVISGMRRSAEVLVWVDLLAAHRAGVPFFRSANSVILTPGLGDEGTVPPSCFSRVIERRTGKELEVGD